jgi:hypothetical protein
MHHNSLTTLSESLHYCTKNKNLSAEDGQTNMTFT